MSVEPKILMCKPDHFDVVYEINAWMHKDEITDIDLAKKQWQELYDKYIEAGYEVQLVDPAENQPDMVFTANGGLVYMNKVVLPRFKFPERQGETRHFANFFDGDYEALSPNIDFEGEGDALFVGGILYGGHGFRSDPKVYDEIADFLGVEVRKLNLINPEFYHLDTCFSVIDDKTIAYYPEAFDEESIETIRSSIPNVITAGTADAKAFGLNLFSDGQNVFVSAQAKDLRKQIRDRGFNVIETDVSEFKKAGGGIKCMTLLLDQIH